MLAGRPHEAAGNGSPRWMTAGPRKRVHRTRPTGRLARRPGPDLRLLEPLQTEAMPLRLPDTIGVQTAHGRFADLLYGDRLRLRGHRALDEAMRAAEARRLAGGQAIDRYASADMAPLLAAELAVWALGDPETAEGIEAGA